MVPQGERPCKTDKRCLSYFSGIKNVVLEPLRVFSLKKKSTAEAFVASFRVLSRKKSDDWRQCVVIELISLRGESKFKPRPQN